MKKLLSLSLVLFFILSCSKDNSSPTAPDPVNRAPVISSITSSSSGIYPGGVTTLTTVATDADGDDLTYTWSGDGTFASTSGSSVQWTAPSTAGDYSVSCTVSDGEATDSESETISVAENHAPVISSITSSSPALYLSETATLTVVATDENGDDLRIVGVIQEVPLVLLQGPLSNGQLQLRLGNTILHVL